MKAPPKRKGNPDALRTKTFRESLNESPSEKEGKSTTSPVVTPTQVSLNESPSEKEGKSGAGVVTLEHTPRPQ